MKTAYLDCFSGISGNMTLAAVIDAGVSPRFVRESAGAVISDFRLSVKDQMSNHLGGVHVAVSFNHKAHHHHRGLTEITRLINQSGLPTPVKTQSVAVFEALARAEARVHRLEPERVHFHEVGAVDAIVDVVGSVAGLHRLGIGDLACSPLPLARGEVKCAHGILPLPAPAVLELVKGVPILGAPGSAELVTPTGAALAVTLCSSFGPLPAMTVEKIGVGLGDHQLPDRPNLLRLIVGQAAASGQRLLQFEAAIDDMNPERYELLMEKLHQAGALEVMLVPVQMKKNRPGTLVRALSQASSREAVLEAYFDHSTTLGVREWEVSRPALERESIEVDTDYGPIRVKTTRRPDGRTSRHPEYDDLVRAARAHGVSLETVELALANARKKKGGTKK